MFSRFEAHSCLCPKTSCLSHHTRLPRFSSTNDSYLSGPRSTHSRLLILFLLRLLRLLRLLLRPFSRHAPSYRPNEPGGPRLSNAVNEERVVPAFFAVEWTGRPYIRPPSASPDHFSFTPLQLSTPLGLSLRSSTGLHKLCFLILAFAFSYPGITA